jgi:DNA-binding transcriptional ArsR family regulator
VNTTLTALAEPNRLQIVDLLLDGPRPVGDIVEQLHLRQPQVSKHLRVLSDAGLVEVRPLAQQRIYSLRSGPFRELSEWLDSYRRLWHERMDRFDEVLQDLKQTDNQKETGDDHGNQ